MSRGYRSIGEVLSLLSAEHSDLTISKIRFLESQGLIAPQRTPSGYRKFFDADIERLDWVLTQQRDHFLPLKEIKRRLAAGAAARPASEKAGSPSPGASLTPSLFASRAPREAAASAETASLEGSVSLGPAELAHAIGADGEFVAELQRLGLIAPVAERSDAQGEPVFDHEALLTARTAVEFAARGMPARTLRMFKVAADREAGVYEQVLAEPIARGDAARLRTEFNEIVELAESLHRQLLRRLLRPHLD